MVQQAHSSTHISNITGPDANHLGTSPHRGNILGCLFRLFYVAADDACIGAQSDQGPCLHAADGAIAAGYKRNFALCGVFMTWLAANSRLQHIAPV